MWVGGEAVGADLAPETVELGLVDTSLEERAGVDPGRRVPLDEHQVASVLEAGRLEEMVEADVIECRRRGETGDVAAKIAIRAVGTHHHRQRIPADEGAQTPLDLSVARVPLLERRRDGVDVRGVVGDRQGPARPSRLVDQLL
jgi:hypothetical protein